MTEFKKTISKEAQEHIRNELTADTNYFYDNWMLKGYEVSTMSLGTTFNQIFSILQEKTMFRPYFEATEKAVLIPTIFAEIIGVPSKTYNYWRVLEKLSGLPYTVLVRDTSAFYKKLAYLEKKEEKQKSIPTNSYKIMAIKKMSVGETVYNSDFDFSETIISNQTGDPYFKIKRYLEKSKNNLIPEDLIEQEFWEYHNFSIDVQFLLAQKISSFLKRLDFIFKQNQKNELSDVFISLLSISSEVLIHLENFDYPNYNPKLFFYNEKGEHQCTKQDVSVLCFLRTLGYDIIIFDSSGTFNIRKFLKERVIDSHRIGDVQRDLSYQQNYGRFEKLLALWKEWRLDRK